MSEGHVPRSLLMLIPLNLWSISMSRGRTARAHRRHGGFDQPLPLTGKHWGAASRTRLVNIMAESLKELRGNGDN